MSDTPSTTENPATATTPKRFCDMIMKGGITSGVVYPRAITKLAPHFIFKNIGGTSAGAIAAAAAAAAELTRNKGGFERFDKLPDFLKETAPDGSGSNLSGFFQPHPKTTDLFRLAMEAADKGPGLKARLLTQILKSHPMPFGTGLFVIFTLAIVAYHDPTKSFAYGVWLTLAIVLIVMGIAYLTVKALVEDSCTALSATGYGLCPGLTSEFKNPDSATLKNKPKPLSFWLHEYLNGFVDKTHTDAPLTFGDLWGTRDSSAPRAINLEMMTTCLTHGRPYRLPFRDDEEVKESRIFFFSEAEFRELFPKSIVDWMRAHPRKASSPRSEALHAHLATKGIYPLPDPANFPVAVATRMSLSFPVLLSAIPLYAIDWVRAKEAWDSGNRKIDAEKCWFTDGGLSSNFPLHFFDSPLPRWPTLSIDLIDKPEGTPVEEMLNPEMAEDNRGMIFESWNRFEQTERWSGSRNHPRIEKKSDGAKVKDFFLSMISTMQEWTDNTQSRLPGYRDRIAHIGFTSNEGGLNLNMPPEVIGNLTDRGTAAAEEFIRRFAGPQTATALAQTEEESPEEPPAATSGNGQKQSRTVMDWNNHRWIRTRSFLASMEDMLHRLDLACGPKGDGTERPLDVGAQSGDEAYEVWMGPYGMRNPDRNSYVWANRQQKDLGVKLITDLLKAIPKAPEPKTVPTETLPTETAPAGDTPLAKPRRIVTLADRAPKPRFVLRPRPHI